MNPQKKPKSLQDRLKQIQRSSFVGREEQVDLFRRNLDLPLEDDRRRFLFNVWGQGGVGKSTLLRRFREILEEAKLVTAYASEDEKSLPEVMGRLAEQLKQQGHKLAQFGERYEVFRQKQQELEADPEAPQGFSAFLGRTVAKTGVKLARRVPVGGAIFDFVDEDTVATQAGEWAAYVAKKLTNKDEVRLVKEPVAELTPLFLKDICKIAEKATIALFFDTYERTEDFLDEWLREILEGRYGDAPLNLMLIVAGRQELDRNRWAICEGAIVHLPLNPFTEDEAKQYLIRKGITNDRVTDVILRLSGCLPLLVATLAAESPNDPNQVGDPSGTAVERFLKWVDDPKRRQVALNAALPRCLNRDVVAQLNGEETADELFDWLKEMPFVGERTDGWAYHDIVKTQMLRHKRLSSPQSWADQHGKLADYYDMLRKSLQLDEGKQQQDATWRIHTLDILYHRLCQAPQQYLPMALNGFLETQEQQDALVSGFRWAEVIAQAGKAVDNPEIQNWGRQLLDAVRTDCESRSTNAVDIYTALAVHPDIKDRQRLIALCHRGIAYQCMNLYKNALDDFNQVIDLAPTYAEVFIYRGMTYLFMKHYKIAQKNFKLAKTLATPDNFEMVHRHIGMAKGLADLVYANNAFSDGDWYLYDRALAYQALNQPDKAQADFDLAIQLAQQGYEKDPQDWCNTINLALYYLAAGNLEQAKHFYRDALSRGVSLEYIKMAVRDLDNFLTIFPEHQQAKSVRQALQKKLQERSIPQPN